MRWWDSKGHDDRKSESWMGSLWLFILAILIFWIVAAYGQDDIPLPDDMPTTEEAWNIIFKEFMENIEPSGGGSMTVHFDPPDLPPSSTYLDHFPIAPHPQIPDFTDRLGEAYAIDLGGLLSEISKTKSLDTPDVHRVFTGIWQAIAQHPSTKQIDFTVHITVQGGKRPMTLPRQLGHMILGLINAKGQGYLQWADATGNILNIDVTDIWEASDIATTGWDNIGKAILSQPVDSPMAFRFIRKNPKTGTYELPSISQLAGKMPDVWDSKVRTATINPPKIAPAGGQWGRSYVNRFWPIIRGLGRGGIYVLSFLLPFGQILDAADLYNFVTTEAGKQEILDYMTDEEAREIFGCGTPPLFIPCEDPEIADTEAVPPGEGGLDEIILEFDLDWIPWFPSPSLEIFRRLIDPKYGLRNPQTPGLTDPISNATVWGALRDRAEAGDSPAGGWTTRPLPSRPPLGPIPPLPSIPSLGGSLPSLPPLPSFGDNTPGIGGAPNTIAGPIQIELAPGIWADGVLEIDASGVRDAMADAADAWRQNQDYQGEMRDNTLHDYNDHVKETWGKDYWENVKDPSKIFQGEGGENGNSNGGSPKESAYPHHLGDAWIRAALEGM